VRQAPEEALTTNTVRPIAADRPVEEHSAAGGKMGDSVRNVPLTHEVLKGPWRPYDAATGLGLEILIPESATQEGIVELLKQLATGKDPVSIRVWTSRTAWENEERSLYGDAYEDLYARHLICIYTKNLTVPRRLYYGHNEIKWIQEKGRFSHLCDQTTPVR
jgi:hypothetical protein